MVEKNKYKLICCDLDGTLLNSRRNIDRESIRVMKKLREKGLNIAITTGRACFDAKNHADELGENIYYMGSNGAVIGYRDDIIFESVMSDDEKLKLLAISNTLNLKPTFVTSDMIYVGSFIHYIIHRYFYTKSNSEQMVTYISNLKKMKKIIMNEKIKVHKVMIIPKSKTLGRSVKSHVEALDAFELAITPGNCFEITGRGTSKGTGVQVLADYLKIDVTEVIAFGDSQNDMDMLRTVGCGVAMANASDEVKNIADRVTKSNDDNGVIEILRELYNLG